MRTLTSIESSTNILLDLEFHIEAADVSTTWIFGSNDIKDYPSISWEIDYTGGLGKPSNYNITLATSMGFVTDNYNKLVNGKSFLKVFVNSDNFTPHVGRVRGFKRDASNPNLVNFVVYDDFLNGNPKIPTATLIDSWTTLHPEVLNADMGYSLYYGKHTRPFYMTPVDCDIGTLLGPRNVSSANHVSSQYWEYSGKQYYMMNSGWNQQSGSDNQCTRSIPFYSQDDDVGSYSVIADFSGNVWSPVDLDTKVASGTIIEGVDGSFFSKVKWAYGTNTVPVPFGGPYFSGVEMGIKKVNTDLPIAGITKVKYTMTTTSIVDSWDPFPSSSYPYSFKVGAGTVATLQTNSLYISDWVDVSTASWNVLEYGSPSISLSVVGGGTLPPVYTSQGSVTFAGQMRSDAYQNYSVYNVQVNCAEIAISENPNGIIADITNQTSFNFVTAQNSAAQVETSSYNFQCYLDVRQPFSDLLQNFGSTTGTYYWIGDSGYINTRTYQESAVLTNSVNYTVSENDIVEDTLQIRDNPVGSIFYQTEKARRVKIEYDYNFTTGKYNNSLVLDKTNNAFCNSADAAGIQKELTFSTKYIKETQTASLYADNVVRRSTLNETIIEGTFNARFMGLEIADALHVKHPSLLNSESLFQVTKVDPNYRTGFVKFTANEILNIN